jgi:hypothetical protein
MKRISSPRPLLTAYRAAAALGGLVLSEAPRYGQLAYTGAFHLVPALAGGLLILPWSWHLVTSSRKDRRTGTLDQQRLCAWRTWQALLVLAAGFAVATLARAPIQLIAPLTLATVACALAVVWSATSLALAMLREDRATAVLRLRWLTVTPGCLLGLLASFTTLGDTWATLLFGCFSSGLGVLLCDVWASVPKPSRAR